MIEAEKNTEISTQGSAFIVTHGPKGGNAMDRRDFLKLSLSLGAMAFLKIPGSRLISQAAAADSPVSLPPLPYSKDALAPISLQKRLNSIMANTIRHTLTIPGN